MNAISERPTAARTVRSRRLIATWAAALTLGLTCTTPALCWGHPKGVDQADGGGSFDHSHSALNTLLGRHVHAGGIDYAGLKADSTALTQYLAQLEAPTAAEYANWSTEQRFAFWINAYNAYTLKLVSDPYPLESIKDLGSVTSSVWKKRFIPLARLHPSTKHKLLNLDELEHAILRPLFRDARVHAAINCASEGCPPLRAEAFVAERIDAQLDQQARAWLADAKRNRLRNGQKKQEVSRLFDWFREDFERDAGSLRAWIARYAPTEAAAWFTRAKKIELQFLDYSWRLNDRPRKKR